MDTKIIDSKIEKLNENIQKEQNSISESKVKIKSYQAEIKSLEDEKQQMYAAAFLKIMEGKGLKTDEEKSSFLEIINESL